MFGLHVWILKKRENATPVSGPFGCLCFISFILNQPLQKKMNIARSRCFFNPMSIIWKGAICKLVRRENKIKHLPTKKRLTIQSSWNLCIMLSLDSLGTSVSKEGPIWDQIWRSNSNILRTRTWSWNKALFSTTADGKNQVTWTIPSRSMVERFQVSPPGVPSELLWGLCFRLQGHNGSPRNHSEWWATSLQMPALEKETHLQTTNLGCSIFF